jgi:hypothetical protein
MTLDPDFKSARAEPIQPGVRLDPLNVVALELFEIDLIQRGKLEELMRIYAWPNYRKYGACKKEDEPRQFATMCTRLINPDLFGAFAIIWKESPFVSNAELAALGLERSFTGGMTLSRYSLAAVLWEASRCGCEGACDCIEPDQGKFKAQADRAIEALLSFQLVEEDETGKPREIRALESFHMIMREYALFRMKLLKQRLPGLFRDATGGEAAQ